MNSEPQDGPGESEPTGTEVKDQEGEAAPPGRKTLHRTEHDKMLAGVAGGLAEYFGVDALLVRLAFFLLLIPGGVGVPLYLAAWILIPLKGNRYSIGERVLNRARGLGDPDDDEDAWVWIALLVIGFLAVGSMFNRGPNDWFFWAGGSAFWSLLLIAAGIWLYRQDQKEAEAGPANGEPLAAIRRSPDPKPRPEPSRLGRYTFASVLVAVGLMATIDNSVAAMDLTIGQYAAIAVGVIGAGLLIGSVWGRSRPLVLLGLLLLPFSFVGFNLNLPVGAGAGERSFTPTSGEQLDDYELLAGELNVDLTQMLWDDPSLPTRTRMMVAFGQINVVVPDDVVVEFDGRALAGQVSLFNRHHAGLNADLQDVAGSGDGPRLVLGAEVLFGQINVERAATEARRMQP